jgi:hypothetical protein
LDQIGFQELLAVLRSSAATVTAVAIVAFFAMLAVMLWTWRRAALDKDDD